jgi:hypothetical protein
MYETPTVRRILSVRPANLISLLLGRQYWFYASVVEVSFKQKFSEAGIEFISTDRKSLYISDPRYTSRQTVPLNLMRINKVFLFFSVCSLCKF